MKQTKAFLIIALTGVFVLGFLVSMSGAGGGGGGGPDASALYEKGVKANKAGDYKTALQLFQDALNADRNNPDILNMLAHSQRKLGLIDEALENYKKALRLRPDFPEAREYLGEAYIQAALREIDKLKSYGKKGEEQREDLIKALKEAAETVK